MNFANLDTYLALEKRRKEIGKPFSPRLHFSWIDAMSRGDAVMVASNNIRYVVFTHSQTKWLDVLDWIEHGDMPKRNPRKKK